MPESVLTGKLHISKACWELWLSDDQPHSDYNGQWQRALCILAVLQSSQPNSQRNLKKWKMYAIKQIKICADYWDMLPRPRLDLSPGLRPIGLSPGSSQTSLGLGSMYRYSAQIFIFISEVKRSYVNYPWKSIYRIDDVTYDVTAWLIGLLCSCLNEIDAFFTITLNNLRYDDWTLHVDASCTCNHARRQ